MTLRHMRIFVAVCTYQTVTMAAEKLYLAQPTVSLAIKELEEYYGVCLFNRFSHRLYLSETGKLFLDYAIHIIALYDELDTKVKNWDKLGTLRIGASITIGTYLLPKFVAEFYKNHPQMKIQAVIKNSEELEKQIIMNDIDFAFIEGEIHNTQIKGEKIMEDELVLICGKDHPLANTDYIEMSQLPNYDFILRENGSGTREFFDSILLVHNMAIKPIWESVSTQAIVNAVSYGLGLSMLPYIMIQEDLNSGRVKKIRIKDVNLRRSFYIIYHRNKFLSESIKEFMDLCKAEIKKFGTSIEKN